MRLINSLWTDENNNTWPAGIGEAEAARRSATLVDCRNCTYCTDCAGCTACTACTDCADFKSNPNRYAYGPIGSRNATATSYWTSKEDLLIVAGCFAGTVEDFLEKVKETHGNNEHGKHYRRFIRAVNAIIRMPIVTTTKK